MRVSDQTVFDQSYRTERGYSYLHVLIALTIFQQPYEKIHSQPNFYCTASWSVNGRPPPHPFDNDIATTYRTSAIFSHRQVDTLPITQNGQDLVSANPTLAEVEHGRQFKLLRAERTAVNWTRRKTNDEPRGKKNIGTT